MSDEVEISQLGQEAPQPQDDEDKTLAMAVIRAVSSMVSTSNPLPKTGGDFELCNSFTTFNSYIEQQEIRIRALMSQAMQVSGVRLPLPMLGAEPEEYIKLVVDANDIIAERSGMVLDELEKAGRDGEVKLPQFIIGAESTARPLPGSIPVNPRLGGAIAAKLRLAHEEREAVKKAATVAFTGPKPQLKYGINRWIDNSSIPFVSKLQQKHHPRVATKAPGLKIVDDSQSSDELWVSDQNDDEHPYRVEYDHFSPLGSQMESRDPVKYLPLEASCAEYVNTKEKLEMLRDVLNKESEIGIDLEFHTHRSFLGLTCLIQISTRTADYIIDPFPIWEHVGILNEPFTDPNILKVFHGCDSDIACLQRDFGIHVINLFDTHEAMKRLDFPKLSLQYLVGKYCDVMLDKHFQTSDWRIRPLIPDQLEYARSDTHYLLYCYDRLREDLLDKGNELKNLLSAVYNDSKHICAKPYEKPRFDVFGYEGLISSRRNFNNRQVYALAEIWKWRDRVAREEDESLAYVLPCHMLLQIAEALPREMQGIIACCNPVPPLVKEHLIALHRIIYAARDIPLEQFTIQKAAAATEKNILELLIDKQNRMTKTKALLRCKIDFSHSAFDEVIGKVTLPLEVSKELICKDPSETFLEVIGLGKAIVGNTRVNTNEVSLASSEKYKQIKAKLEQWASPYECYVLGVKEAAKKEAARLVEEEKRKKLAKPEEKTMFSHHDATVCRKPDFSKLPVSGIDMGKLTKAEPTRFDDSQLMTNQALKRRRQKARKAADIRTDIQKSDDSDESHDEESEGPSYRKKFKTEEGASGQQTSDKIVQPVDYAQYDKNMFNQQPKPNKDFDPFGHNVRIENKKNYQRRGRGGFHRMGTMSTGFVPKNKKN